MLPTALDPLWNQVIQCTSFSDCFSSISHWPNNIFGDFSEVLCRSLRAHLALSAGSLGLVQSPDGETLTFLQFFFAGSIWQKRVAAFLLQTGGVGR